MTDIQIGHPTQTEPAFHDPGVVVAVQVGFPGPARLSAKGRKAAEGKAAQRVIPVHPVENPPGRGSNWLGGKGLEVQQATECVADVRPGVVFMQAGMFHSFEITEHVALQAILNIVIDRIGIAMLGNPPIRQVAGAFRH